MYKLSYPLVLFLFTFFACRNTGFVKPGESINISYQKGIDKFEVEKYGDAAEIFEIVTRSGRGTNFAQNAQYYLAESYYRSGRYILSAAEYERFISLYPRDERREEVDYKRALSVYQQSPRYRLDQSSTLKAIELFQLFNSNYPNSEYVIESAERINELRNKLARKYFESAEFYARTDQYNAATIYYDLVIDKYPESDYAEAALISQIEVYNLYAANSIITKQADRYELAIQNYEKFIQLFPESNERGKAESLKNKAEKGLREARKAERNLESFQNN